MHSSVGVVSLHFDILINKSAYHRTVEHIHISSCKWHRPSIDDLKLDYSKPANRRVDYIVMYTLLIDKSVRPNRLPCSSAVPYTWQPMIVSWHRCQLSPTICTRLSRLDDSSFQAARLRSWNSLPVLITCLRTVHINRLKTLCLSRGRLSMTFFVINVITTTTTATRHLGARKHGQGEALAPPLPLEML